MKQIHFKGSIRNLQNQLINLEGLAIDFFDSSKNKWLPLIKGITVAKGEIEITYSISKRKTVDKKIIEVIEKGLFPSFRLSWNKTSKVNKVFRIGGAVEINSDTETTVHFGELYLVEISGKQKSTSGIDFQQVAIPKIAEYNVFFKELITGFNSKSSLETKNLDANPSLSREALSIRPVEDDSTDNFDGKTIDPIGTILPGGGIGVPIDDIGDGNGGGNSATINALNQLVTSLRRELNTRNSEILSLRQTNTALSNQNDALVKERNNLVTQGTYLRNENIRLSNENQTLNGRVSSLQSQVSSLNNTISTKNAHIAKLDAEIKDLKAQIVTKDAQISNLGTEIRQLKTEISRLETQNTDLDAENHDLTIKNETLRTQLSQKQVELELEIQKNETLEKEVKDLEDEKKTLETDLSEEQQKVSALSQEKDTLIAEKGVLESELAIKEQEIVVLNTEKNELELEVEQLNISHPGESKAFKINDIYRQLVEDVNSASLELKNVGNYQLGNVTIDLKTHIQNDDKGLKVQTLDKDSAKSINEGAVSNVKINIESTKEIQKAERVSVPDFSGLTEKAAKKKALQFNVKLTPIYQYNQTERIGSAFMQLPKPGARVLPLTKVKVFFAKN
ncbi:hypothetical protein [Tenacibaculum amylolyticum]|uniref:hypothetical protein n=1 Tax=Tenacibaculum amylolyticum TaxID=104269 RepID=UPI003895DFE4